MGTYLRVLSESYPINTNMTGFRGFSKPLCPSALDESKLSIGRGQVLFLTSSKQDEQDLFIIPRFRYKLPAQSVDWTMDVGSVRGLFLASESNGL